MISRRLLSVLIVFAFLFPTICFGIDSASHKTPKKVVPKTTPEPSAKKVCPTNPKWATVCTFFNKYQAKKQCDALIKTSVEQQLGEVCIEGIEGGCAQPSIQLDDLYRMGIRKDDKVFGELVSDRTALFASLVDIDNDGNKELCIRRTVGSAKCMHSYFWKKDASNHFRFVEAKGYDRLAEEGSGCGSHYEFIPYLGSIYTLCINYDPPEHIPRIDTVWKGSITELKEICTDRDCN